MCLATLIWSHNTEVSRDGRTCRLLLALFDHGTSHEGCSTSNARFARWHLPVAWRSIMFFCFLHGRLLTQATGCWNNLLSYEWFVIFPWWIQAWLYIYTHKVVICGVLFHVFHIVSLYIWTSHLFTLFSKCMFKNMFVFFFHMCSHWFNHFNSSLF